MPRSARSVDVDGYNHVLNRGNGRMTLFHKPADYLAFVRVLGEGLGRYPVDLLAWCLMPNHWHLVLRPRATGVLGRLMGWVGVTHVRRHHAHYHSTGGGHLYQGRFKAFAVQDDRHFLTVCRYVEANAVRAKLTAAAQDWPWSSLHDRAEPLRDGEGGPLLRPAAWPVDRPRRWTAMVNRGTSHDDLERVRLSVRRERPFGDETWTATAARRLGLTHTLRPRGRPRKPQDGQATTKQ